MAVECLTPYATGEGALSKQMESSFRMNVAERADGVALDVLLLQHVSGGALSLNSQPSEELDFGRDLNLPDQLGEIG